jgi:predicted MPP superfamily phosphohydrolase
VQIEEQPAPPLMPRPLTRRQFLKRVTLLALGGALAGAGGWEYASAIEPGWLDVQPVTLTLPRLAPAFDGYRVVQFSDIHMGPWMTRARLADVVGMVNAQGADLIVLTGDFVSDLSDAIAQDLIAVLRTLRAPDGAVAVLGNHDHWTDAGVIHQVIKDSGLVDLTNTVHTLDRGSAPLHLAGVDDIWEQHDRLDAVLGQLPNDGAAILLAHEPDFADTSAATGRFDLQLSGHSHGGQVIIPFVGPPHLPYLGRKYPLGRYQVGRMIQYTNRGVGMIPPRVRFNCRPEITVFTLRAPAA